MSPLPSFIWKGYTAIKNNIHVITSTKETLSNLVVGSSVCSWVACACSKREKSRKEVVDRCVGSKLDYEQSLFFL